MEKKALLDFLGLPGRKLEVVVRETRGYWERSVCGWGWGGLETAAHSQNVPPRESARKDGISRVRLTGVPGTWYGLLVRSQPYLCLYTGGKIVLSQPRLCLYMGGKTVTSQPLLHLYTDGKIACFCNSYTGGVDKPAKDV